VTLIALEGDFVIGEPEAVFRQALTDLLEAGKVRLLVDCGRLRTVDSTGLGSLVRTLTLTQRQGGQTKLLDVGPRLLKLLELTALAAVFEIHTDRAAALASF
jgi:anti-sigma B factor antagonist